MPPFCPQCGVDNPANARFCDQCGAALIPVPAAPAAQSAPAPAAVPSASSAAAPAVPVSSGSLVCPQCGAAAIPGEAFCDNCGAPLNAPARPVSQAPAAPPVPAPPYNAGVPPQPSYPPPQPQSYAPPVAPPPSYTPQPMAPPTQPPSYTPPVAPPVAPPQSYAPPAAAPRQVLAPARLIVASSGAVLSLPNAAQAVIGRADQVSNFFPEIDLNPHGALENGVGRRHLRLLVQGGQLMVEDLDSTNGTLLNGQKLAPRQPQPLRDGDQLVVGKLLLRFQQ